MSAPWRYKTLSFSLQECALRRPSLPWAQNSLGKLESSYFILQTCTMHHTLISSFSWVHECILKPWSFLSSALHPFEVFPCAQNLFVLLTSALSRHEQKLYMKHVRIGYFQGNGCFSWVIPITCISWTPWKECMKKIMKRRQTKEALKKK